MRTITSALLMTTITILLGCGDGPAKDAPVKDGKGKDPVSVTPKVDTPDTIKADIMANMKSMTAIFDGVTDEASAKAALPKIQAVRENMRGVAARARKVKVSDAEKKMQPTKEEIATMTALQEAIAKLREKPALMEILAPALEGMENDM
jgi:hypothetical protein